MKSSGHRRIATGVTFAAVVASFLSGCASGLGGLVDPSGWMQDDSDYIDPNADDWIIVHFVDNDSYTSSEAFDQLFDTETAADEALYFADQGWIDGNEIGGGSYDLYFTGYDTDAMWDLLEPVFAEAPLAWTSVELLDGLEDESPTFLNNEN